MLSRMGDDLALARSIVEMAQPDIEARLADLQAALECGDREAAVRAAHSIKGMALDIGADGFSRHAKSIEAALREERPCDVAAVAVLAGEYGRLKLLLADWLRQSA